MAKGNGDKDEDRATHNTEVDTRRSPPGRYLLVDPLLVDPLLVDTLQIKLQLARTYLLAPDGKAVQGVGRESVWARFIAEPIAEKVDGKDTGAVAGQDRCVLHVGEWQHSGSGACWQGEALTECRIPCLLRHSERTHLAPVVGVAPKPVDQHYGLALRPAALVPDAVSPPGPEALKDPGIHLLVRCIVGGPADTAGNGGHG